MDSAFLESKVRPEEWLERLMDAYGTDVLRLCYAYLKDAGMAEDAAQETFLKAFRYRDRYKALGSEKAWLMRIAANTAKDMLRSAWLRHMRRNLPLEEALVEAKTALYPEENDLLEDVMALKPRLRVAVILYYYQNLTAEEVARVLNISTSAVYYRLRTAQEKLRAQLIEEARDAAT